MQTQEDIALAYRQSGGRASEPVDVAIFEDGSLQEKSFRLWYKHSKGRKGQLQTISFNSEHSATYFVWGIQRLLQLVPPTCGSAWLTAEYVDRQHLTPLLKDLEAYIAENYRQFPPLRDPDRE